MRRLALLGVLLAGLLAACGGGGHTASSTTAGFTSADKTQIGSAYAKFFSGKSSVSERASLLQNGSRFTSVIQSFAANPLAKSASASVISVAPAGSNRAKVVYKVNLAGASLGKQTGYAVRQGGRWKVGDASLCKLIALGGTTPSVCKKS